MRLELFVRDGVTLAKHTHTKPLVLPSEMSALKDCEAYLKLPGDWPVTKHQMTYKNVPPITAAFLADAPRKAT